MSDNNMPTVQPLRVAMITASLAADAESEDCGGFPDEPCIVLTGSKAAVGAAGRLFGEDVCLAAISLTPSPVAASQTPDPAPALGSEWMRRAAAKTGANAAVEYWSEANKPIEQRKYGGSGIPGCVMKAILAIPGPTHEQLLAEAWALPEIKRLVEAAEKALAGDLRELQNRVELCKAEPVSLVLSAAIRNQEGT